MRHIAHKATIHLAALLVTGCTSMAASASFVFPDFTDTTGLNAVGSTSFTAGSAVMWDPTDTVAAGGLWHLDRQSVVGGFTTTFEWEMNSVTSSAIPADGLAFVIQDSSSSALQPGGSSMGYSGMPAGILAVEIDNFSDIGLEVRTGPVLTIGAAPVSSVPLAIGAVVDIGPRTATITYTPGSLTFDYDGNGTIDLTAAIDLTSLLAPDGSAYVGFTAAVGGFQAEHVVNSWSFSSASAVPEPATALTLIPGLALLGAARRRRRRESSST